MGGASVIPFLFSVPPSVRRKVLGQSLSSRAKRKSVGGFRFSFNKVSPTTCPNIWRAEHYRKILFSLKKEKIGDTQNEKDKEYFSVMWRACRSMAQLTSILRISLKKKFEHQTKTLIQIRCFCLVEMERFAARSDSQYGALRADLLPTVSRTFRISRLKAIKNTDSRSVFLIGGEGEIRTLDKLSPMTVFKTVALNHSATSPR